MHPFRKLSAVAFPVVLTGVLLCAAAMAQGPAELSADTQANNTPPPPSAQKTVSPSDDDVWHFDIAPYVFVPGVHGTAGALGHYTSVHVSGSNAVELQRRIRRLRPGP